MISQVAHIEGWVGGGDMGGGEGWVVVEGEQLEAGYTFHYGTGSIAVSSKSDKNRHNPQAMPR